MTTISQTDSTLYVENSSNNSSIVFTEKTATNVTNKVLQLGSTGIYNYYPRTLSGLVGANATDLAQIGGNIDITTSLSTPTSTTGPVTMISKELPSGTYFLTGFCKIGAGATALTTTMALIKFGCFFDTTLDAETSTLGSPYYASKTIINNNPSSTGYIIQNVAAYSALRIQTTMLINLTTTTTIYMNIYCQYSGSTNTVNYANLQILRIA